jgi:hypothetical protein
MEGMEMEFPDGKAGGHCGQVEIHCGAVHFSCDGC